MTRLRSVLVFFALVLPLAAFAPPALADDDRPTPGAAQADRAKERDRKNGKEKDEDDDAVTATTVTTTTTATSATERAKTPPGLVQGQPKAQGGAATPDAQPMPRSRARVKIATTAQQPPKPASQADPAPPSAEPAPASPSAAETGAGDRSYYEASRAARGTRGPGDVLADAWNYLVPSRATRQAPRAAPSAPPAETTQQRAPAAPEAEAAPPGPEQTEQTESSGVRGAVAEVRAHARGLHSSTGLQLAAIALVGAALVAGGVAVRRAAAR